MIIFNDETIRTARHALKRAKALHLFDPNVSHIDLGLRIKNAERNRVANELAVRVHLRKKLKGDAFKEFSEKYPGRVIDSKIIGFPIDIPEAQYKLHHNAWWRGYRPKLHEPRARYFDELRGGISISNAWSFGYGTLGGLVTDRQTGDELLLSNWHVVAGSWFAKSGLSIQQPAIGDGGTVRNTVAHLVRDAMAQSMDAAVAKLNGTRAILNDQLDVGPVAGVHSPQLGMIVMKSGRRSKVTTGIITGIAGDTVMNYGGFRRIIKNIVHIAQIDGQGEISAPGDSGSWWLRKESNRAAALHFAGSNTPEFGLAISMPKVLDALNVTIGLN